MDINLWGVLVATLAQFAVGALWYMPLFGKQWGKIHGFDRLDKKTQANMQAKMGPYYGIQLLVTALTAYILAHFMVALPTVAPWQLAIWLWAGFVVPTQVSAVVFGGTDTKWIAEKISIMAGGSLACLLAASLVLHYMR